ncbi:LRR receptor-like serine threonine-protein kinase [Musa troglodytarum]|uniref:LRR receptor-like serine threonine-protein kinase n=1 Tax=Musa troglodytarum TaxID=320322 RepID=A0A9E7JLD5_9LILI|nr:LRR receptor-like serine threonine-protein kinase [Musa troglodytarum]
MGGRTPLLVLTFSLAVLSIKLGISHGCRETERKALIDFKRGLHDPSNRLSSWVGEDCCAWEGVGCSNISGHQLNRLDLSGNYFMHKPIPKFLGAFRRLTYLNLSGAGFMGRVPAQLGNLSTLQHLDLSYNCYWDDEGDSVTKLTSLKALDLSGSVFQDGFMQVTHISNLCKLQILCLSSVPINDVLANLEMVFSGCLRNSMEELDLSGTQLSGSFPDWLGNIKNLKSLDLSSNSLCGSVPASIGNLSLLQHLSLGSNDLNGTISKGIGQLKSLVDLDLHENSLSLSEDDLANLSSLEYLDISYNFIESLHGSLPASLGNLSMLRSLDLGSNNLNGMFPESIKRLKGLRDLDLYNNSLSLSEDDLANLSSLKSLDISYNSIYLNKSDDWIPPFQLNGLYMGFCQILPKPHFPNQLRNLEGLQLYENNLSRVIPNCWKTSSNLLLLDLSSNKLVGGVPDSLCNLQMLESLHLSHNNLSGQIPHCLKSCTELATLDLGHNNFIGNIPTWIGESLLYLKTLSLRSNAFTGSIPQLSSLPSLRILDLSNNNLSGTIPQSFGDFRSELEYTTRQLSMDTLIDLSNNYLSGNIPEELGNLHGLRSLNLSKNYLIGQIPWSIGRMKQLEVLDLSRNNLSGAIPSDLAALNFLNHLNLSYNNLSGRIPNGNQLQTFTDSSIYAGNPNLCGPPLTKNCTLNIAKAGEEEQNEDSSKSRMETLWLYTSITLGFIIGFWAICGSLLLQQTWRTSYFRAIDNMFDKLYVMMVVTVAKYKRKL